VVAISTGQGNCDDSIYTYKFENFDSGKVTFDDSLKIWVDSSGLSTLDDVVRNPNIRFSRNSEEKITSKKEAVWTKFKIHNASQNSLQIAIIFCHLADSIHLFSFNPSGDMESMTLRATEDPRTRAVVSVSRIIDVNIGKGSWKTFYAKVHLRPGISPKHLNHISINLLQAESRINTEKFMIQTFFTGIMMLFCLVSFVMYGSFKEQIFIQFGILMICLMLYFLKLHGLMDVFVIHNMPIAQNYLANIFVGIINISLFQFVSGYINLKGLYPKYAKALWIFTLLVSISAVVPRMLGVDQLVVAQINNILMILWIFGIIHPVVRQTLKKDKAAKILLISIGILFFGALLLTLSLLRVIPQTPITKYGMQVGTALFSTVLFYGLFQKINTMKLEKLLIGMEKEKSEALLDNILPPDIATQLKETGSVEAQKFNLATVLFTDFKGFTNMSELLNPQEIIKELNICFSAFDAICEKHHVEKIKTIGDAYMAVGGIPIASNDSVKNTVLAGIEMKEFITDRKEILEKKGNLSFQMRVGIHSGPIVAGIVGTKKFHYDIWGDTVNTASRMESSGEVGKVNISETTYQLIKDLPEFTFEKRGKIQAKGKGEIEMFFVRQSSINV
jgi:class 3 adenylate cyclase